MTSRLLCMKATLERLTNSVVDTVGVTFSTVPINRQPAHTCQLVVRVTGLSVAAVTVTTEGLNNAKGDEVTDSLVFSLQSDVQQTTNRYDTFTNVTLEGTFVGMTLGITAVDRDGSPTMAVGSTNVIDCLLSRRSNTPTSLGLQGPGMESGMKWYVYTDVDEDVRKGDRLVYNDDTFQVQDVVKLVDQFTPRLSYRVAALDRVER